MSWDTGNSGGGDTWQADTGASGAGDAWGGGVDVTNGDAGRGSGEGTAGGDGCRICHATDHFARDCPEKPEGGGGLTDECYNCGEIGHNKADCTNPHVERPFTGTCYVCNEQGHQARDCPSVTCKLCGQTGHKALECKGRRLVDWTGIPDLEVEEAWKALVNAGDEKDLDKARILLRAYAKATVDIFSLRHVEQALREDNSPIYLIAQKYEIAPNATIVGLTGTPGMEYILSLQLSAKPRRAKMAQGWPSSPEENLERLEKAGLVQDRGIPICSNCGELGHIKKSCDKEIAEHESTQPIVKCVYCQEEGHRARDCQQERVNRFACKNCKQEGHNAKECPEPRSAEGVECRKCNETGHFSRDCHNVEARTCRNCGSADHIAKECDQPRNPDLITCRNCEKKGHLSRECPEPTDWSKVKCNNCGQMGHTIKRCREPVAGADNATSGDGGRGTTDNAAPAASASGESAWGGADAAPSGGESAWGGDAGASGGGGGFGYQW